MSLEKAWFFTCYLFIFHIYTQSGRTLYNTESAGVTDNLTDEDIKMALWDLSVNDLITLNKLIDLEKQFPYDYNDERGYYDIYRNKDYISDLSDSMETEKNDYANLKPFYKGMFSESPHNKDLFNTDEEAVQTKREENLFNCDAEYVKLLHDSFPRDDEANVNIFDMNKNHVRVKRHLYETGL